MNTSQKIWIEEGYHRFAESGPQSLKVEQLAKSVGKNKSSFYHYFADLKVFTTYLLEYQIQQAHVLAQKEAECESLEELIEIILAHKIDLLFNRQLRIHRENVDFKKCFEQVNEITISGFLKIWAEIIGLEENSYLAGLVLQLSLDNFFLQITDETLHEEWLKNYFHQLKAMVRAIKKSGSISPIER